MTKSIYGCYQIGDRLHTRDGYSRGLGTMAYSRLAAEVLRSRDGKASGLGFQTNQELKTKKGFAPFAPLPLCGKRALRWQEQDAGEAVVDHAGYLYDGWNHIMTVRFNTAGNAPAGRVAAYVWGPDVGSSYTAGRSMQSAGGVGGLLMVLDGVSTSEYNQSSGDPTDDDYFPLMDRMGNVTGYKKASTTTPATQLDAIYDYDAFGQEIRSTGPAADVVPYHFSTKFTDATGLVYYGYRWYDAAKGRWLSKDPIGERGGVNLYGFVGNKANRYDFMGLCDPVDPDKYGNCPDGKRKICQVYTGGCLCYEKAK